MIKVSVDEGYAFDMLSILQVKAEYGKNDTASNSFLTMRDELVEQLTQGVVNEILASEIYGDLYYTNLTLFKLIDELKSRDEQKGDAARVDSMNYTRFQLKKRLQSRFFPAKPSTEIKLGYS